MTLLSFIRLLLRFKWMIILTPLMSACVIYLVHTGKPDTYESETMVYTGLVSGFNIESGKDTRMDFHVVNSGFDNLINTIQSRETLLNVAIEIMSRITCADSYSQLNSEAWHKELVQYVEHLSSDSDCDAHRQAILNDVSNVDGTVHHLLFSTKSPVSLASLLSNLSVRRVSSSDLLEIKYSAPDPQLAQEVLVLLNASFIARYQKLKRKEVGSVVRYFEVETNRSYDQLQVAVDQIRAFGTDNRVINFYEQTKAIAGQKELIDQQIRQEEMNLHSAESAQRDLELRIGATETIRVHGSALVEMRQRLTALTTQQVLKSVADEPTGTTDLLLYNLGNEIQQGVADLYRARYSKEGLVKSELVERWLDETVNIAQSLAALEVLLDKKEDYIKVYDQFAPMGSALNTLEREVDIAEREYLELLHSLNQARMRQQNIEMSSSMDVLDKPNYPYEPIPSKITLLMLAGFMASAMLSVGLAVSTELLDQSLRSPENARLKTGMEVIGFLPDEDEKMKVADLQSNIDMCLKQMTARLLTLMALETENSRHLICIGSASEGNGKTHLIDKLEQYLVSAGRKVIRSPLRPENEIPTTASTGNIDRSARASTESTTGLKDLPPAKQLIILKELSAFSETEIPVQLIKNASCLIWVARADSLWTGREADALEFAKKYAGINPLLCLNKVKSDRLEVALGGTMKRRSSGRNAAKRVLQRNFS